MPTASEKITEFPKPADRPSPLSSIPAHLVTEERDPAREIRNLIEQLQETALEARRNQRKAEEESDQMRRRLSEIENHRSATRPEDPHVKALTHERDVLLQQQNQYGPVIADLKHKLKIAEHERADAIRHRDLALMEKKEAGDTAAAARRNFADAQKALADLRKGGGMAKTGDGDAEHHISALRQARDGMSGQITALKRKIGELEDRTAELSYNRDAIENDLKASQAQVRKLQKELEANVGSASVAGRIGELEADVKELEAKLFVAEDARTADAESLAEARSALLAAQSEMAALTADGRGDHQRVSGSIAALEKQIEEQRAEIATLERKLGETEARLAENEKLTRQFDKRRLDMIELVTQLENAQREIRTLSAYLAEARLHAKLAGRKPGTGTTSEMLHARAHSQHPSPVASEVVPRRGAVARENILALRSTYETFNRDHTQSALLKEMENRASRLADGAKGEELPVLHQVASAFAAFLGDLHEIPEQISQGSLRTVQQTLELLEMLVGDPAAEQSVNLAEARTYVVDDDAATCATVVEALDVVGLQTNFALYSSQAVTQLAANRYDLIVLDVHLPDLDGFELCSRIRSMPLHEETPVFFITGNTSLENRVQSSLRGGNEFIAKPFNMPELGLRALRAVITSQLRKP